MNKRNRSMPSFFHPQSTDFAEPETGPSTRTSDNLPRVAAQLKPGDIEPDPGKRIPIKNLDPDIRDLARREYISAGPCQPKDHKYERKLVGKGYRSFHDSWYKDEDNLVDLANMYAAYFSEYEVTFVLRNQLDSFIHEARTDPHLMNCNDLGHLAMKMVLSDMHTTFSLVYRLVELALILPVATATVERAFSAMSIIKTDLRNKMDDDWMNHRMVCYIERDVFVSIKESKIIERFQGYRSRKGILPRPRGLSSSIIENAIMGSSDQPMP